MTAPGNAPPGRGERGAAVVELTMIMPVAPVAALLVVQPAMWLPGGQAADAAARAVRAAFPDRPVRTRLAGGRWRPGGSVRATVICELDLGFFGFGATKRMVGAAVVPLERFRRVA